MTNSKTSLYLEILAATIVGNFIIFNEFEWNSWKGICVVSLLQFLLGISCECSWLPYRKKIYLATMLYFAIAIHVCFAILCCKPVLWIIPQIQYFIHFAIFVYVVLGVGYGYYRGSFVSVVHQNICLGTPMKIVHLSDLHLGPIHGVSMLGQVIQKVQRESPDFVAITGDLVDGTMELTPETLAPFRALSCPIYFVLGNHEYVYGISKFLKLISHIPNITVLRNNLHSHNSKVNILGLDFYTTQKKLAHQLDNFSLDSSKINIVLHHGPFHKMDPLLGLFNEQ